MKLDGILDRQNITIHEFSKVNLDPNDNVNLSIVQSIGEINLIVLWKLHFIKYGKPKHMPDWWKPNLIKIIKVKNNIKNKSDLFEIDMKEKTLLKLIKKYELYETAKLYF